MLIRIKTKNWELCIVTGRHVGQCSNKKSFNSSPIFAENNKDLQVFIGDKHLKTEEMYLLVDNKGRYGKISKIASELSISNDCNDKQNLVKLSNVYLENRETDEKISMESLLSLLENNPERVNERECNCSV